MSKRAQNMRNIELHFPHSRAAFSSSDTLLCCFWILILCCCCCSALILCCAANIALLCVACSASMPILRSLSSLFPLFRCATISRTQVFKRVLKRQSEDMASAKFAARIGSKHEWWSMCRCSVFGAKNLATSQQRRISPALSGCALYITLYSGKQTNKQSDGKLSLVRFIVYYTILI